MANQRIWDPVSAAARPQQLIDCRPILLVCFTNHALDQFLEGIAEFMPTGLLRIGGRCKNKAIAKYTLAQVRFEKGYGPLSQGILRQMYAAKDEVLCTNSF